ncbi:MAG: amylo-alpha-1,6-glucosidase [Pseudothermotoga sp.]
MFILKKANLMAIFSEDGSIDSSKEIEDGLYFLDTKVIKRLASYAKVRDVKKISTKVTNDILIIWELCNFDGDEYELLVKRSFCVLEDGIDIGIEIRNLRDDYADISLRNEIDFTAQDIFDVRRAISHGINFENKPSTAQFTVSQHGARYECPFFKVEISNGAPETLERRLLPKEVVKFKFHIGVKVVFSKSEWKHLELFENSRYYKTKIDIGKRGSLGKLLKRSLEDLDFLLLGTKFGPVPAAGTPWFTTIFGRDSLLFCLQAMNYLPDIVRNILSVLSYLQADAFDNFREMQPGKILHETRTGEVNLSKKLPFALYYGSIDSTLLYIICMHQYWKTHHDDEFILKHKHNIEKAFEWIVSYGDTDRDGYVEYSYGTTLKNQGWKDSSRSIVRKDGTIPPGPIALSEVQAYYYGVLNAMAEFQDHFDFHLDSDRLLKQAKELKNRFNTDFWLEEEDYFAIALDGNKKPIDSIASNPAYGLLTKIIDEEKAVMVVKRLFSKDMMSKWGIRTMSNKMKSYNPFSYHNGSVWPHDNSVILMGLMNYGYTEEAQYLARKLLRTARFFSYRLPELFSGLDESEPFPYPVSCSPQLWSIGSAFVIKEVLEKE